MLDQRERCHGFEHRDFYFLTFAGSFPVNQCRRRRMNRHVVRPAGFMVTSPARRPVPGQKRILTAGEIDESANITPFAQIHERLVDLVELVMPGD
jgi:hypothetical protein